MGQLITKTDFVFIPITSFVYQAYFSDPDGNALIPHHRYAPPGVIVMAVTFPSPSRTRNCGH